MLINHVNCELACQLFAASRCPHAAQRMPRVSDILARPVDMPIDSNQSFFHSSYFVGAFGDIDDMHLAVNAVLVTITSIGPPVCRVTQESESTTTRASINI